MEVKLSIEFLNQLCGYLATKPYQEVAQLLQVIQQAANEQSLAKPTIK